jgi:hypothetical protein
MKSTRLVALMMALSLFACRSGGKDDDDNAGDDNQEDDGGAADDTPIYDIQSDDMEVGTAVTVREVVVVAVDTYGGRAGGIYVMEPEGGPYSGVFVFLSGTAAADLSPGDLVDIEGGVKDEFALDSDETGRTLTEISPPEGGSVSVTKVGDGEVPEPETVTSWDLVADEFAAAEQWEGVLVRFENVRVQSAPEGVTDSDETLQEMRVTGPFIVQSALTSLEGIESGACYSSIVGIGDYFFDYKLLPRSADDLVTGADEDCLPVEATDELCDDGADNDYNGYADCEDFACADATVACPITETSVAAIQDGTVPADSDVSLVGVTVTGIAFNRRQFWVQDTGAAAENNGVFVFQFGDAEELPPEVVVGATLDLSATVLEFDCGGACVEAPLTELSNPVISNVVKPAKEPAPFEGLGYETVVSDVDGEPYEGVLVRLENVAVVRPDAGTNEFSIGVTAAELIVDDIIFRYLAENTVEAGQCLSSITGIMHRDTFDDFGGQATILPRSAADIDAASGTCN